MKIQDLIAQLQEQTLTTSQIAQELNISQPMVSQYKKGFNASLDVAIHVYKTKQIALFPFSKEALKELSNER